MTPRTRRQRSPILHKPGYRDYLGEFHGVSKLRADPALLYPRARFLREWVCAGIVFDQLAAAFSHLALHDSGGEIAAPLIKLTFAVGSYRLRPATYRLHQAIVAVGQAASELLN